MYSTRGDMKKRYVILLILAFTCSNAFTMAQVASILGESAFKAYDMSLRSFDYAKNSVNSLSEVSGVKALEGFRVNSTTGFKCSVALLGIWTIPLLCNLARWQWKKHRVERKIRKKNPTLVDLRTFYSGQLLARRNAELFATLTALPERPIPADIIQHIIASTTVALRVDEEGQIVANGQGVGYDMPEDEIKEAVNDHVRDDMNRLEYQPLMSDDRSLAYKAVSINARLAGLLYTKRYFYDAGSRVLWHGFAYGPGRLPTWFMLGAAEACASVGLSQMLNKIFVAPRLWYKNNQRDPYVKIGELIFRTSCLYLNMMLIDGFVTSRLK